MPITSVEEALMMFDIPPGGTDGGVGGGEGTLFVGDPRQTPIVSNGSPESVGGSFAIGNDGHVFFTFDPSEPFQPLNEGDEGIAKFNFTVNSAAPIGDDSQSVELASFIVTVDVSGVTQEPPDPPAPPPGGMRTPTPIPTSPEPTDIITFNDPASLGNLPDAGRYEVANNYTEDCFTFRSGVIPPDPELGGTAVGVYRLAYENPFALAQAMQPTFDPAGQPRSLFSFGGSDIIQMTYDPDGDGVLDPFSVQSIRVLDGTLNVGVRHTDGTIAVYNNLTSGFDWTLIDATDLTRVTLEAIGPSFTVDDIHIL